MCGEIRKHGSEGRERQKCRSLTQHKQTGELTETCTIITTEANEVLKPVHDRMPVILKNSDYDFWLDKKVKDTSKLQNLLVPFPAEEMDSHAVSRAVNIATADSAGLVVPVNSL